MKYCLLLLTVTLLVSTVLARGHHENRNRATDTEQTLRNINSNVDMILSVIRAGFEKLEKKTNRILEYVSSKPLNNGSDYSGSDYWNSNDSYSGSDDWNSNDSSSGNNSFNIYDEIDYEACVNETSNTGQLHEFSLNGPAGANPLRDFQGIPESEQPLLNSIRLSNLNIEFSVLVKSLQFSCNLEEVILKEVTLSFTNGNYSLAENEIYLPNLNKYHIQFSETKKERENLAHLLPFKKAGSKFNTDILITNLPWSSITLRVVPSQGRIEAKYYGIDEEILSNLEPDFELKELVVDGSDSERSLEIEYIPTSLRLLKLGYYPGGNGPSVRDILKKFRVLKHFYYTSSAFGTVADNYITLQDLPEETLESLSLRTVPLKYVPGIKFPLLERINLVGNNVEQGILENFSTIFPGLKKLVLDTSDSELVKRLLNLPDLSQLVVRGSSFDGSRRDRKFKACHKDHWCNIYRDGSGNWAGVDITADLLQGFIDNIFPEFKDFSLP